MYFLALLNENTSNTDETNREIGQTQVLNLNECLDKIRPYHKNKIKIIKYIYWIVNNFIKDLNGTFELLNNNVAGCTAKIAFDLEIDELNNDNQYYNLEGKKYEKLNVLLVESDITNSYTLQKA